MPRLFSGIELPREIREGLSLLRGGLPGATWHDPDHYHLTLRFLGDVPEKAGEQFAQALADIYFESFELSFLELGSFGGNKPRAIWAGFKPSAALENLQKAHERAARRAGDGPETRNYVPHVTLARLRNTSPFELADCLASNGAISLPSFCVKRFVLFSSRPNYGGGPYVVEEAFDAIDTPCNDDYDDTFAGLVQSL